MITNKIKLERFNRKIIKEERISYKQALLIYEALRQEAVSLGAMNPKNILEGLEVDIKIAKILNRQSQ